MKQVTLFICTLSVLFQLYSMAHAAPADLFSSFTSGLTNGASSLLKAPASFISSATDMEKTAASAMTSAASSLPIDPANMMSTAISSGANVASALENSASNAFSTATNAMSSGISGGSNIFSGIIPSSNGADATSTAFNGLSVGANFFGSIASMISESVASKNNGGSFADRMNAIFNKMKTGTSSVGTALSG